MGASNGVVKRDVLAQLSAKGRVGGRNPIATLCSLTGNNSETGRHLVEMAVRDLVRDGCAQVKADGRGKITEILHRHPREHRDRTERSAQAKREDMFAKGVPAYLPDSMCSPVEVRHVDPKPKQDTPEYSSDGFLVDNLNACLLMLRQTADEQGYAESRSVRKVLLQMPGVTNSIAGRMMDYLQGMSLYVTAKTGFQTSSYTVDLETVVTQAMVDEYRQARRQRSADVSPVQPVEKSPGVEVEAAPATSEQVLDEVDPVVRLAEIIEELEVENTRLHAVIAGQQDSIVELSERCTRLTDDLAGANEELARAQALLDAGRAQSRQVDGKVADILARHQRR